MIFPCESAGLDVNALSVVECLLFGQTGEKFKQRICPHYGKIPVHQYAPKGAIGTETTRRKSYSRDRNTVNCVHPQTQKARRRCLDRRDRVELRLSVCFCRSVRVDSAKSQPERLDSCYE